MAGSQDRDSHAARASSFGAVADVYERARPGYPEAAVLALAGSSPCDVLDLAAGTGKLTRSLVALGHRVTAVDPSPEMLAVIERDLAGVVLRVGTAEKIPLGDGTLDVVTVAQAFHWFDPSPAYREIARVLRPGGVLGLVWNWRVPSSGRPSVGRCWPKSAGCTTRPPGHRVSCSPT